MLARSDDLLRIRVLIFGLQLDREPDECFFCGTSQRKIDLIVLFFDLTSSAGYGWREIL